MAKTSYDVPAVRHAVQLIELLGDSPKPLGVAEICKALDLNNNMVFRLLKTLEDSEWVVKNLPGPKYSLGLRLFHHAIKPVRRMSLKQAASEPLEKLWEETGESCYLGIKDGTKSLFLDHYDSRQTVRITAQPGGRFLMHCSAPGKALLAYSKPKEVGEVIKVEGLPRQTKHTIHTASAFKAELEKIRRNGFALDIEEYSEGLLCYAVPILNHDSELVGTVGLSVLTIHYTLDQVIKDLGPKVNETGREISSRLGYVGPFPPVRK
jgi:IclR family transcriptional regulator, KDG regulon repressor